jgi:hypothetical protein
MYWTLEFLELAARRVIDVIVVGLRTCPTKIETSQGRVPTSIPADRERRHHFRLETAAGLGSV